MSVEGITRTVIYTQLGEILKSDFGFELPKSVNEKSKLFGFIDELAKASVINAELLEALKIANEHSPCPLYAEVIAKAA